MITKSNYSADRYQKQHCTLLQTREKKIITKSHIPPLCRCFKKKSLPKAILYISADAFKKILTKSNTVHSCRCMENIIPKSNATYCTLMQMFEKDHSQKQYYTLLQRLLKKSLPKAILHTCSFFTFFFISMKFTINIFSCFN